MSDEPHEAFIEAYLVHGTVAEAEADSGVRFPVFDAPATYYVYLLIDPRDDTIFYVGKGKGRRALAHRRSTLNDDGINLRKLERVQQITAAGLEYEARIVSDGMKEGDAFILEGRIIRALRDGITNLKGGTRRERAQERAKAMLLMLKPREALSLAQQAIYDVVVRELHFVAEHGEILEVVSEFELTDWHKERGRRGIIDLNPEGTAWMHEGQLRAIEERCRGRARAN